jgi:hypothetical protein
MAMVVAAADPGGFFYNVRAMEENPPSCRSTPKA